MVCCVFPVDTHGRLGETLDQSEARYGLEKQNRFPPSTAKLVEESREVVSEYGGYLIRCALLPATDGNSYIVREEYKKVWNGQINKAGGVFQIRDFERNAILEAEGGQWHSTTTEDLGAALPSPSMFPLLRAYATFRIWTRSDGAIALRSFGDGKLLLNLPQAFKYEAGLHGVRDQQDHLQARQIADQTRTTAETTSLVPPHALKQSTPTPIPPGVPPVVHAITPIFPTPHSSLPGYFTFAVLGLLSTSVGLLKRSKRGRKKAPRSGREQPTATTPLPIPASETKPRNVESLDWEDFELLVGEIYRRQGFKAELSAVLGADGGIDLTLHRGAERVLLHRQEWNMRWRSSCHIIDLWQTFDFHHDWDGMMNR